MSLFGTASLHQNQFRSIKFTLEQFHPEVVALPKRMFGFHLAPASRMRNLVERIYLIGRGGRNEGVSTYWWQWWVISTQLQLLEFFGAPPKELRRKLRVVPQILVFLRNGISWSYSVWLAFSGVELNFKEQSSLKQDVKCSLSLSSTPNPRSRRRL